MIRTLTIRNIALIEEATIDFHHGLNVLSGETGAGKSIILYAVNLILGGRADKNMIRSGCERASVEAIFESVSDPSFNLLLTREAIENNGDAVVLSR
jgi:DNA repair protein RecN (Recombination protein N)